MLVTVIAVQNPDSSLLILSGELDSLVSFGDVRAYLGLEAGQCSIRRNGQECEACLCISDSPTVNRKVHASCHFF